MSDWALGKMLGGYRYPALSLLIELLVLYRLS